MDIRPAGVDHPGMVHPARLALLAALVTSLVASGATLPAQGGRAKPDPIVAQQLDLLETAMKDREMAQDGKAETLLGELRNAAPDMVQRDATKTVKAVRRVFLLGKHRGPGASLYREAARTLSAFGPIGAPTLLQTYESKRFEDDLATREMLLRELGRTGDERQVGFLLKTARRDPDNGIMAAAGEGLGNFAEAPIAIRRKIVDELLVRLGEVWTKATDPSLPRAGSPEDLELQNAKATLLAIQNPWYGTLGKLTGQSFKGFEEWQRWLNKNPDWGDDKGDK